MKKESFIKWGVPIVAITVVLGVIGFFIFTGETGEMLNGSISMGDVLVTHSNDNKLNFHTEENELLETTISVENSRVALSNDATGLYILEAGQPSKISKVWLEQDALKVRELHSFEQAINLETIEFKWATDFGAFFDSTTGEMTVILPEFFETKTFKLDAKNPIEAWTISDDSIYYAQNQVIYRLDFEGSMLSKTSIEDATVDLQLEPEQLIVISQFGSGNGEKTILSLNSETLAIEDLSMITASSVKVFDKLLKDETIYFDKGEERLHSVTTTSEAKVTDLSKKLADMSVTLFGYRFAYVTDETGAYVYQLRSNNPEFSLKGDYQAIYPLNEQQTVKEETTEEVNE